MEEQKVILITEIGTKLDILIQDFRDHKDDDDQHNNRQYKALRELPDILEALKKEISKTMEEKYATKLELEAIKGLKWAIWGAFTMFSVLTWLLTKFG